MDAHELYGKHERSFESYKFVYPVLSRRARGLSIGINLNPDKVCNFKCVYCQVDRTTESQTRFVETDRLLAELRSMLAMASSGQIFATDKFRETPEELRRINDIAFSGDGESTTYTNFAELMEKCAGLKREMGLDDVKMVLITNASMFERENVRRGLDILDHNQGEIWAKLDVGTAEYYQHVNKSTVPFARIVKNIMEAAQKRPIVIQTLFMKIDGAGPSPEEQTAYTDRLNEIINSGGSIKLVQIYTIARPPAEANVAFIEDDQLDEIAEGVRRRTSLPVETYYGRKYW